MVSAVAAGASAAGLTRHDLVAELARVVGAPHEARFIVDEVAGRHPRSPDRSRPRPSPRRG